MRLSPTKMTNCGIVSTVMRHIGCLNRLGSRNLTTTGLKHPKTMKKSKGKKPVRVIDDELEYDSNSEEREEHELDELNVKGDRVCLNLHFFF